MRSRLTPESLRFTHLPDKTRFMHYVEEIFESGWVTNRGHFYRQLESKLGERLGNNRIVLTTNGTVALQIAIRLLKLSGKVITTPLSFVATVNALLWEGLEPVFVDIDGADGNIDPDEIEAAIDSEVSAIMPVHLYGNPCEVDRIERIASKNSLSTIYDAAAAFDVHYRGTPVVNFGTVSVLSFHATKLFSTVEGGALILNSDELYEQARVIVMHGFDDEKRSVAVGTNSRMSEFHAAYGLCGLSELDDYFQTRSRQSDELRRLLAPCGQLEFPRQSVHSSRSVAYFPILFPDESILVRAMAELASRGYESQRYFYPTLNTLPYLKNRRPMPKAEEFSRRVVCLPIGNPIPRDLLADIADAVKSVF